MASSQRSLVSIAWLTTLAVAHLALQFVLQVWLARWFGADRDMDCFAAAFAPPTVLSSILAGSLGYLFVPLFVERRHHGKHDEAWSLASSLAVWLVAGLVAVATVCMAASGTITDWLYGALPADERATTARLLSILIWTLPINGLTNYLQSLYQAERRFITPQIALLGGMAVVLATTLALQPTLGIYAAAIGAVVGNATGCVAHLPILLRNFRRSAVTRIDPALRQLAWLAWPLALGSAYYNVGPVIDRYLAAGLPTGSISHLAYASRIINAILMLTTSGLSIVIFPKLAAHAAAREFGPFREDFARAVRFLLILLVPTAMGLMWLSRPLVRDLFERGRFTPDDTHAVGTLLALYLGMIVGASLNEIAGRTLFAMQAARAPVVIGVASFTLGIVLKLWAAPRWGAGGIAAATSVYYLVGAALHFAVLSAKIGVGAFQHSLATLCRSIVSAAVTMAIVAPIATFDWPLAAIACVAAFVPVYFLGLCLTREPFAFAAFNWLSRPFREGDRLSVAADQPRARGEP